MMTEQHRLVQKNLPERRLACARANHSLGVNRVAQKFIHQIPFPQFAAAA
ncbi:hypothetical protein Z948_2527 [Sulfitobacter donghicola DSW-25 = KCTC 12864 = JCM 14565]|nr:hypothetical protein Z948_2527 [Sulfitobacter donghicola DSW-25 = KCTC 12864 = JCM 14565]